MTYATLMTHLDPEQPNAGVLALTAALAQRFDARVIGIAACQPMQIVTAVPGEVIDLDRQEIDRELSRLEAEFHAALAGEVDHLEWRSARTPGSLAAYIADEARAADLIVTAPDQGVGFVNASRRVSVGELVMQAGRPLFLVPQGAKTLNLDTVVIGWKDSPESRRAIADAVPLLKLAGEVSVVEIGAEDRLAEERGRLDDVIAWLGRHDVAATPLAAPGSSLDTGGLEMIAREKLAGLLVAGAYGHTRLREWVFGGVTCDVLLHPGRCALVSH